VHLVRDRRTGGGAVLRINDLEADGRVDRRVEAEHAILTRLDSPGVPKTYGLYVKAGRSYLAREHFDGEPLDQVVARGVMTPEQIFRVCRQLCVILGRLHTQTPPVIHRDVKPQNVILRPDGSLGLTDFGIARTFKADSDSDTSYAGTMPYAPPEQYGYAQSSPQTDVYALGILLIYLATGSPARQDLGARVTDGRLRALIERCIAFDPKDRFRDVAQVAKKIDAVTSRRRRGAVAGVGGIVLAAVLFGVWRLLPSPEPPPAEPPAVEAFDSEATGNLPGNILNGGFAVEGPGVAYLAADGAIWEVAADGTAVRPVAESDETSALNYWRGDLYYASHTEGVVKVSPDTGDKTVVTDEPADTLYVDGGRLYFQSVAEGSAFYSVNPDGSDLTAMGWEAADQVLIHRGFRYFSNPEDSGKLYRAPLDGSEPEVVYDGEVSWLAALGHRLYFSDMSKGPALMVAGLDGAGAHRLARGAASWLTAAPGGLFYVNDLSEFVVSPLDGGSESILTEQRSYGHCVANGWAFYEDIENLGAVRMVRLDGSDDRLFAPAGT
jgi:hypothetical protein